MTNDEIRETVIDLAAPRLGGKSVALRWMNSRNPNLGDVTPAWMIAAGRGDRLLKWMHRQIEDAELDKAARLAQEAAK